MRWVAQQLAVAVLGLGAAAGCAKDKCAPCAQDSECGSGMVCHPEFKVCKPEGKDPACAVECEKSKECQAQAMCSLKGTKCVIGELDCAKSALCSDEGRCTRKDLGPLGTCVSINAADCEKSTFCRTQGHCSVDRKSRLCRAMSDGDCKQAEVCTAGKKCTANVATGECVAGGG